MAAERSEFDAAAWVKWWDANPHLGDPNTQMAIMVLFGQLRDLAAAPSPEPLPREALEAMRQVHARHDLGHKVGAWANACALCEAYRSVAALSPDRPTP